MRMDDYLTKYDSLASEDALFDIPIRKEYLLKHVGRGRRVLDVGCLGGRISKMLMDQNNDVWGVELNPAAAAQARKRGVRVEVANVEDGIPFGDAFFDIVNAGEVLEHLYDTKNFFREANRVLKEGGALIFTTHNLNSLENRVRVAAGGYLSMAGAYPEDHFGDHVRVFNLSKIRELCEQTGFRLEEVRGIPTLQPLSGFLKRPVALAGKLLPGLSKLLIVKAVKR
jgi:2-polyprenyl-3-methyl-5-hydroxy-6-metoxy-1,4-benzoquinol methylase